MARTSVFREHRGICNTIRDFAIVTLTLLDDAGYFFGGET